LKERIDSTEPLSLHDQMALVFEIEAAVRDGRAPDEIQEVLLSFKRRDDLLAKIAARLDEAQKALKEKPPVQGKAASAARPEQPPPTHQATAPPATPAYQAAPSTAKPAGTKSRRYACRRSDSDRLIDDVKRWLDVQGFDLQQMQTEHQGVLLQIKRRGGWRDFVGMAAALNIVFTPADDTLNVEIGSGKWLDKAAVGTVSIFILWPLAITAGFGAWDQMKMPDKIFAYIENRFVYA
jgi:hypothetical protein